MKIGVFGSRGRLGSCLISEGCIPLECDILDEQGMKEALSGHPVDTLINCAAYTNVDEAETPDGQKEALKVNSRGVFYIKKVLEENFPETRFIHISSDYVFSGHNGPYTEHARPYKPINQYGWSKYGGEIHFLNPFMVGDVLVRATGLYGGMGYDFSSLVVSWLKEEEDKLLVTEELYGNQTYAPHLAKALIHIAHMREDCPTIVNVGSREVISRYEFAKSIATHFGLDSNRLVACSNSEIPIWEAKRPTKGGLDTNLAISLGIPIYTIEEGLKELTSEI